MFNLIIFVVTVVVAYVVGEWIVYDDKSFFKSGMWRLLFLALLYCPFNVDGNIITVFGNVKSEGNIYSVFSPYQSGKNTYALFGALYQSAEEKAIVLVGLSGYQQAKNTLTLCGLAGYQKAERNAEVVLGLSGYQKAGNNAVMFMGLSGYQKAGKLAATKFGLAGYQEVGEESRYFGLFSELGEPLIQGPAK
ncbi:MAG: hypothetical protein AAB378_00420 [Patescibacteria group bacterium]